MKFVFHNNTWWEYKEGLKILKNKYGVYNHYIPNEKEIIESDGWDSLDYSYLIDNDQITGWISPEGIFYGCKEKDHNDVADYIFHCSERELEEKEWVKIYKIPAYLGNSRYDWYKKNNRPTAAQKKILENNGFLIETD